MTELSTGQQILDRVKTADDIEEYLDFCVRDLTNDENYRSKKSKERLISRISGWMTVLGDQPVINACRIIDMGFIHVVENTGDGQLLYLVGNSEGWTQILYIYSDSNHCDCEFFKDQVMDSNNAYLCEHLIAIRLAKLMKLKLTKETLDGKEVRVNTTV